MSEECIQRRVYRNTPEFGTYLKARFPAGGPNTGISFEFDGHRWAYQWSSFDDAGDYDLIWRPKTGTDAPPTK